MQIEDRVVAAAVADGQRHADPELDRGGGDLRLGDVALVGGGEDAPTLCPPV
jgi:hypothetical protein